MLPATPLPAAIPEVWVRAVGGDFTTAQLLDFARVQAGDPAAVAAFCGCDWALIGWGLERSWQPLGPAGAAELGRAWAQASAATHVNGPAIGAPFLLGSAGYGPADAGFFTVPTHALVRTASGDLYQVSLAGPISAQTLLSPATWAASRAAGGGSGVGSRNRIRTCTPGPLGAEQWAGAVAGAAARLRAGEAEKVVLARDLYVTCTAPIDTLHLATRLGADYPTCWSFHLSGLIGATPEMLADTTSGSLSCRVLAGTASFAAGGELLNSAKDRAEHAVAVRSVEAKLAGICPDLTVPRTPSVLRLPNLSHLATTVTGTVPPGVTSLDVALALHPTAAVCGMPEAVAQDLINHFEQSPRGRYSAPVGWMDRSGQGQWALALRLGQVDPDRPDRIRVIAGAGIMPDSDPAHEVRETELKMRPLLAALDG